MVVLLILSAIVVVLWGIALAMHVASADARQPFAEHASGEIADLPGWHFKLVRGATLTERQEARRQRLACAGCPAGRDPIDVELAEMLRVEQMLREGRFP